MTTRVLLGHGISLRLLLHCSIPHSALATNTAERPSAFATPSQDAFMAWRYPLQPVPENAGRSVKQDSHSSQT